LSEFESESVVETTSEIQRGGADWRGAPAPHGSPTAPPLSNSLTNMGGIAKDNQPRRNGSAGRPIEDGRPFSFIVNTPEDMEVRRSELVEWASAAPYTQFVKVDNEEEIIEVLSPRRGNRSYAKRQRRRFNRLFYRLGTERYSIIRFRNRTAETQDFLFTFTYDQNEYTIDEANARVSNDLKKMRTYIHRILGSKFGSITCYESTKRGYPAPHMIVRLDRSYPVFSHLSKKTFKRNWRLTDRELVQRLQDKWRMLGGGWFDIKGIVDDESDSIGAKIHYLFKYLTKTLVNDEYISKNVTALNTLANNKAFNRGTVYVSSAFIQRTPNPVLSRLDIIRTKLQQANNRYYALRRKIRNDPSLFKELKPKVWRILHVINVLQSNLPPPEWKYYGA